MEGRSHYMTNYATKHDVSQYQLILTAYTLPTTIRRLNLRHLRYRLDHVLAAEPGAFGVGDETARVTIARNAPSTFFDHYRWRGPRFSGLCLYEYVKLVVVKTMDQYRHPSPPSMRPTYPELLQKAGRQ